MKNRYFLAISSSLVLFFANAVSGQMVGDCVFLKGKYVEVGVAPNGGYGSTLPAPAGYHPNLGTGGGFTFWDPAAGSASFSSNLLGFVADYGADGWTVGTPPYFGDYYLPGTPQEGWAIKIGTGVESDAYIPAYNTTTATTGFTGGLAGTNISYVNSGGISKGIWQGTDGPLAIRQTTVLDTNKLYFTVNVVIINTSAAPAPNIYYIRTVDPDNEETVVGFTGFPTINTITYQLPNPTNKVLVSATGVTYTNAYLGLGTKDCRAKCTIFHLGALTPAASPDSVFNGTASPNYLYAQGSTSTEDVGIGLVFDIGTIAPGDSTTLSYAYILNATYIDSALNSTLPQFNINGTPSLDTFTATINFCQPPSPAININMVNGGFYHWSYSPTSYLSASTGPSVTLDVTSITADITYTITGISPCDTLHYYLKVVHQADTLTTSPVTLCQFAPSGPLTVSVPATDTLEWWTTPTGGVSSPTAPIPSTATAGTTTYYVSEHHGLCSSARAPILVTITPQPPPPSLSGLSPYCFGQTFVPFIATGTGILWYTSATGGIGTPTSPTVYTGAAGTDTFWATQTIAGCEGARAAIATTVLPKIVPEYTYVKHYGCHGDTVRFTNLSVNATKYSWAFGDGSSDTATNPAHIYLTQGTFTVKQFAVNSAGCVDSMLQTFDLIHPIHSAFTATPGIICQKQSIAFANSSIGTDSSFMWYFGNGATDTAVNTSYTYNNTGVYTVKLITKDFVPCYDTATQVVYVDTISGIKMNLTDSVLCGGTYITLTGLYASIGNTGVTWSFGNGDTVKNVNPVYHAFGGSGQYTVTVTSHYRVCPDTSTRRTVNVFPQPTINLGPDTTICKGSNPIVLKDLNNNSYPQASYLWNTGERTKAITIVAPGQYFATVTIDNCHASDSILVGNDCYMNIPNAFTPNGDGLNDYFYPRQLLAKGLTNFKMNIYNRWGQLIFETTSLDGVGWDGKLNNVDQPSGVYVYVIDAAFKDGQKEHHQGNVTLLR